MFYVVRKSRGSGRGRDAYGRYVINVRLLHHGAHCLGDIPRFELVVRVFVPDGFEVKIWSVHEFLEEG